MITWDNPDIGDEEISAATESLKTSIGAKGQNIKLAEREFCDFIGCKHAILTSNGTTALYTALHCSKKIDQNDISVPSFTFIASYNSAKSVYPIVRLCDNENDDWNCRNFNSKNILSVDVGGVPCDYDRLKANGHYIIADSAESLGSTYKGKQIGTQADVHCFSFQRSKIITCGEGGLITTDNDELAEKCRKFINHGYSIDNKSYSYVHDSYGLNFRICDVEAAILRVQLKKLNKYISHRNNIAAIYDQAFRNKLETQPLNLNYEFTTNRFFYGVLVNPKKRTEIVNNLIESNIQVKCWTACHKQNFIKYNDTLYPNASKLSDSIILLPIHNKLSESSAKFISQKVLQYTNND